MFRVFWLHFRTSECGGDLGDVELEVDGVSMSFPAYVKPNYCAHCWLWQWDFARSAGSGRLIGIAP